VNGAAPHRAPRTGRFSARWLRAAVLLLVLAPGPAAAQQPRITPHIEPEAIRAHLGFLADDLLEGRAPGTRGGMLAAHYIAAQLAHAGVSPIRGSYYQPVPLHGWRADPRRMNLEFSTPAGPLTLRHPSDAVIWLNSGADSARVTGEVVFAGYGVRAPEYQWDDFKGRDLRGRILLVLVRDPPAPPGQPLIFDGGALTWYGRWSYKVEEARRQGVAAVLIVHTTEGAGYPWSFVQSAFGSEQLALPHDTATPPRLQAQGWLAFDAARRLLAGANLDLDELFVRAARRDFQPVFTGITATLRAGGTTRSFVSSNVAGVIEGRHAQRRNEYVIYTAHYDGLGIGPAVDGDSIYNGAYDNASGVALLLEIVRAFAAAPPERSVVFLFTTAEEAGLLGATWYVRNPLFPLQRTVAALNIDGANIWGETHDASAIGMERSTLGSVFEAQAAALGLRVSGERAPDKGFFFRSDHFPFARAGVPALFIDHGTEFVNRTRSWSDAVLSRFEAERYHQPLDRFDPAADLRGAAQQGRLAFLVGNAVANTPAVPRWYRGAELPPVR
jgi:Zn-dependent M28 family amino/carboxypeptidase